MLRVEYDTDLQPYNTFGISAKARCFVEFSESYSFRAFLSSPPYNADKFYILGGGSNTLFKDDFEGCIIHPVNKGISITVEDSDSVLVEVQAGEEWDVFVQWAVSHNLGGVENLTYIPGNVGACPVQNIGAYGAEAKDSIVSVEVIDLKTAEITHLSNRECKFGYRDSIFKHELAGKKMILSVLFKLTKNPTLNSSYQAVEDALKKYPAKNVAFMSRSIREIRQSKLPEPWQLGNAGSFFKNPIADVSVAEKLKKEYKDMPLYMTDGSAKLAAGWLIEQAGWKGKKIGNVGIHEHQALVLVNHGGATGAEIIDFSQQVSSAVNEKFGITLQPEVNII